MDTAILENTVVLDRVLIELRTSGEMGEGRNQEVLKKIDEKAVYAQFARRFEKYLERIGIGGVVIHVRP